MTELSLDDVQRHSSDRSLNKWVVRSPTWGIAAPRTRTSLRSPTSYAGSKTVFEKFRSRMTYANVMVTVLTFVVLGGGAYAAQTYLKKDSVKSKHIKDGGVKNPDLASGAVSADKLAPGAIGNQAIADGSINGGQIADNSITGTDVDESSLDGVNAGKVGGMDVKKINFQVRTGTVPTNVLLYPDLFRIQAECQSFGDGLDVFAFTGVSNSRISVTEGFTFNDTTDSDGTQDIRAFVDSDFDVNEPVEIDLFPGLNNASQSTVHFATPDGFVAVVHLDLDENNADCKLTGYSVGG